jgi:peptidyl-prolyl cis-trans isomerase B (cyclophilin B)
MGYMSRTAIIFITLVVVGFTGLYFLLGTNQTKQIPDLSLLEPTPTPEVIKLVTVTPTQQTQEKIITPTPTPTPTSSPSATVAKTATITTSKGNIKISFYGKDAPKTVENFVNKAKSGFYKNLTFHRVEDWVAQGGDPKGNGTGGGSMPTELNDRPFTVGSVGVARGNDIKVSNDSQFFITKTDASWLTKQYTNFGIVTDGMKVVNTLEIGDKILSISTE